MRDGPWKSSPPDGGTDRGGPLLPSSLSTEQAHRDPLVMVSSHRPSPTIALVDARTSLDLSLAKGLPTLKLYGGCR